MRLSPAILVIVQLLLRGVAVPHVHAAESDVPGHTSRPHVHLAGHAGHHADAHHHHHGGRGHGHAHDTTHTEEAESGLPDATPAPGHDDDAVYISDDTVMLTPAGRSSPTDTAFSGLPCRSSACPFRLPRLKCGPAASDLPATAPQRFTHSCRTCFAFDREVLFSCSGTRAYCPVTEAAVPERLPSARR